MSFKDHIQSHDTLESTMSEALKAAENGAPHGTTIVAATQTAGRGRRGRSWFSPEGADFSRPP